jgi:hypothetical protein
MSELEAWLEKQIAEIYSEIEEIESGNEPDNLAPNMTEVEILEIKLEVYDDIKSALVSLK